MMGILNTVLEYNGIQKDYTKLNESELKEIYHKYVDFIKNMENIETSPFKIDTDFYAICIDGKLIGEMIFRKRLNADMLINAFGHISYKIKKTERGKGYATQALKLMLDKAWENGYTELQISCKPENIASRKTIEKNNGIFARNNNGELEYWFFKPLNISNNMKKLIFIGGAMGTGKSTVANMFVNNVKESVLLDGDWCWYQGCDWQITEENKAMVEDNICYLLNNFLKSKTMKNIVFCWVLHLSEIYERIIKKLRDKGNNFEFYNISLVCDKGELQKRILNRAKNNNDLTQMDEKYFETAWNRMEAIKKLDTIKIDVSNKNQFEVFQELKEIVIGEF